MTAELMDGLALADVVDAIVPAVAEAVRPHLARPSSGPEWSGDAMADLVAALGELTEVPKAGVAQVKSDKGGYSYRYLELPDLLSTVRAVFARHHLAVTQLPQVIPNGVSVVTVVLHASGASWAGPPMMLRCGSDAQSVGGAITYGRRYSLASLVGLAGDEDDDGAHVTRQAREAKAKPARSQSPPPSTPAHHAEYPDAGAPSSVNLASDASRRMMWALLRKTGMDAAQIKGWVASVLQVDPDWHTDALTQAQVSVVINHLKAEPADEPPPEDPPD